MNMLAVLFLGTMMSPEQFRVADLSSDAAELKAAFNGAKGMVRLVLIVSPG
jgi:hypothetical protein